MEVSPNRQDCPVQIRLADEYSRAVTEFNNLLEALKIGGAGPGQAEWSGAAIARQRSEEAWEELEAHIAKHKCLDLHWSDPPKENLLQAAAMAALDVILVADDQRRLVDLNDAAEGAFGASRRDIVGHTVDEFFTEIHGTGPLEAWRDFIAEGVQSGICVLKTPGDTRRFEYRAKANFAPGLHLGVLREVKD